MLNSDVWEKIKYCLDIKTRDDRQRCLEKMKDKYMRERIELDDALNKKEWEIEQIEKVLDKVQEGIIVEIKK